LLNLLDTTKAAIKALESQDDAADSQMMALLAQPSCEHSTSPPLLLTVSAKQLLMLRLNW
jgi:hypothetical protein